MKKILLSVCVFLATAVAASAQLLPAFNFGLKGGVNFSELKSDFYSGSNRTGYLVGAWARIGGAGVHFQPELYLAGKGSQVDAIEVTPDRGSVEADAKVNFTSLDLPLLIGTRVGIGPLGARFHAGPHVSFIIDQDENISDQFQQVADFSTYKNQAFAITGGVGLDISQISLDLRYEHGLSNISKNDTYDQKLRLFNLSLGFKLL